MRKAVNQNPSSAYLPGQPFDSSADLLQVSLADLRAGHHHTQSPLPFHPAEVPPETGRITIVLLRELLKGQYQSRLPAGHYAVVNKLHPQRRLARARRAFNQIGSLGQEATTQHLIQTWYARLHPFHEPLLILAPSTS